MFLILLMNGVNLRVLLNFLEGESLYLQLDPSQNYVFNNFLKFGAPYFKHRV